MTDIDLRLHINSNDIDMRIPEDAMLLEVLRERLGLKGTRFGCGQEKCGACMVLIDGEPDFSCTRTVATATGKTIETVESLKDDDPLLVSLLKHQAAQCAYCLPGIIMSAKALLKRNPCPNRRDVLTALQPHLCRCGAHQRIVNAILSVEAP